MISQILDTRSKKIIRRPGNAKPQFISAPVPIPASEKASTESKSETIMEESDTIKMKEYDFINLTLGEQQFLLERPVMKTEDIMSKVRPIIADVKERGDDALREYTLKFDKVSLQSNVLKAPFDDPILEENVKSALDVAFDNIYKFHAAQLDVDEVLKVETMPGVFCSRFVRAIENVGIYVPGGTAVLPSTALMLGIPALVAKCKNIVIATPPRKDGSICPEVVYVAKKIGASTILIAGGAQAISALAFGTNECPKVDKICGPGNQFVTAAKMLVQVFKPNLERL